VRAVWFAASGDGVEAARSLTAFSRACFGGVVSIEHIVSLTGHAAWPLVALISVLLLRPFIAQVARAAADMKNLLDRSGELVGLVGQIAALNEAASDIKSMQQFAQSARPDPHPTAGQASPDQLWQQIEKQWKETREQFRSVAQSAGVAVHFSGSVGVREAANAMVQKGIIQPSTASDMSDLSAQFQYLFRSATYRAENLNENVVGTYTKTASQVRQALKSVA
jgi:hypothetical protein